MTDLLRTEPWIRHRASVWQEWGVNGVVVVVVGGKGVLKGVLEGDRWGLDESGVAK